MTFWKRLFGKQDSKDETGANQNNALYETVSSEVESRLPGTLDLDPILTLVPPNEGERIDFSKLDMGPDPVSQYSIVYKSNKAFLRSEIAKVLHKFSNTIPVRPTLYCRIENSRSVFLVHGTDDPTITEISAGWRLSSEEENFLENVEKSALMLGEWMANFEIDFVVPDFDKTELNTKFQNAQQIINATPGDVSILVWAKENTPKFDGKLVWITLHAMGIEWGDMDQFQWKDASRLSDYLFWAEVDDQEIGFALPDEIANGRQHFATVNFTFDVARSYAPKHILNEMHRAALAFAERTGGEISYYVDGQPIDGGIDGLKASIQVLVDKFDAIGVKPGETSVLQLR